MLQVRLDRSVASSHKSPARDGKSPSQASLAYSPGGGNETTASRLAAIREKNKASGIDRLINQHGTFGHSLVSSY